MSYKHFTEEEYTKGREKDSPLSDEQKESMHNLLTVLDKFREKYGKSLIISSGYRPQALNSSVGGSKKSNHIMCLAVDFQDDEKQTLGKWCIVNISVLEELGLYMEDLRSTKGWVHLQHIAPKSGKRIFIP